MMTAASSSLPGPHNITRAVLDNGVVVLVYENHAAQSVVISGAVRAGSELEPAERNGLAALTADALMRGTETRDFAQIHAALEDIGADLSISAGIHRTSFYGKALAEDLTTLVDVLADVLQRPTFPPAQVDRLRGEIITGLQYRSQDTRYRANRAFHEALYPTGHPYHYSVRGSIETVSALDAAQLAAFHQQYYGPRGAIIVVVGAVHTPEAVGIIEALLSGWRHDEQASPPVPPEPPCLTERRLSQVTLPGKTQSDLVMGVAGPSRFAADYHAATLVNSVLGQFGMMGRIGAAVREQRGLAYYAYSQLDAGFGPGPWSISAGVNPANVALALECIEAELRRITSEPVSPEDLADNQSYYVGRLPLRLESNEGIASTLLQMEMYDLGLDYLLTYRDRIYSLTPDDLLVAAQHYLKLDALVIGIAGPNAS
ncbi:MAG: pitrilysin family protein [Aggregatilineales bacterium]